MRNFSRMKVRKSGKLPGGCITVSYSLEYGEATVDMQRCSAVKSGTRVLIVDDLLATGGTMKAACDLAKGLGAKVEGCFAVIELKGLKGRDKLPEGTDMSSFITF